jgi:hypothetical protein
MAQKISSPPGFDPGPSRPYRVAIPTTLSRSPSPTLSMTVVHRLKRRDRIIECDKLQWQFVFKSISPAIDSVGEYMRTSRRLSLELPS